MEDEETIKVKFEALKEKLTKAENLRKEIELKRINKAKELYTKYGPTEAQKEAYKKKKATKKAYKCNWFIASDTATNCSEASQNSSIERTKTVANKKNEVFVQFDTTFVPKNKISNVQKKQNAVAFDIERPNQVQVKRAQTARANNTKKADAEWEIVDL